MIKKVNGYIIPETLPQNSKDRTMRTKLSLLVTLFFIQLSCLYPSTALAVNIKGVELAAQITQDQTQQVLRLNGAGTRTKFFFDIYVGALYLSKPSKDSTQILNNQKSKRISMTFLYDKVEKKKMTDGWTEAFKDNLTGKAFNDLNPKIDKFNGAFADTLKGDVVIIDFVDNKETVVTINNTVKSRISGSDFQRAVLSIWLGESPADDELKQAMLGQTDE